VTVVCRLAVSVVAPFFDGEDVLPLFLGRVGVVLDSLSGISDLVLVDEGSSDRTWEVIEKAARESAPTEKQASTPLALAAQLSGQMNCR
jgi:polyisoprenyl-phosphate glycosyltransferase